MASAEAQEASSDRKRNMKEMVRQQYEDFVGVLDRHRVEKMLSAHGILFSKSDKDPNDAPKGFEKFFRKRNQRKEAAQKEDQID